MHSIIFENAYSDWNEALPMGNGVFGGMVYYKDGKYTTAMNHYEVYYSIFRQYEKGKAEPALPEYSYESYVQKAKENIEKNETGYLHYRKTIWPDADEIKDAPLQAGTSHPPTGEFSVRLQKQFIPDNFRLQLNIENAEIKFFAEANEGKLDISTKALITNDVLLTAIHQSEAGIIEGLDIVYPLRRNHEEYHYDFFQQDERTFGYYVTIGKKDSFRFCVLYRLAGTKATMESQGNQIHLAFENAEKEIQILTHVITELTSSHLEKDGISNLDTTEKHLPEELEIFQNKWESFFKKSSIQIPDQFLEKIWYLNLYVLECCSGKGGKRYEHACGLNGLWDIRQPTLWGSMWYWDVNIQSAFWGVYASNHIELAEVFNEGLLFYADYAKKRAEEFYHMNGYAIDFPHEFYNCILPWCAQHLWWYYEYTLDPVFLKEKAYPFFKNLIYFVKDIAQFDEEKNEYYIFPDVSPEQGPITQNSTITLATIKYLLTFSIQANEILGESEEDKRLFTGLLEKWAEYPLAQTEQYGEILRDSELAPPAIALRHPSLLMPVFPIGEMTQYSGKREMQIAKNTLHFSAENTEIGVFPFGWIASAAARCGEGNTALRILYEQGMDLILRANGMGAEETDRWINHCPAELEMGRLYYPCMMESVGGIVSAVNEMLLQSHDHVIHLFPALPDGTKESWRNKNRQKPLVVREENQTVKWEDCEITNMLAKGGFEVSAKMRQGKVCSLHIKSLFGSPLKVDVKENVRAVTANGQTQNWMKDKSGYVTLETDPGAEYTFLFEPFGKEETAYPQLQQYHRGISYVSHLGRRVFCGKDAYTDVIKIMDGFLHDYYVANDRYHNLTTYKFSFGVPKESMKQIEGNILYEPQRMVEKDFLKITENIRYSGQFGFGFEQGNPAAIDTGMGNVLLQDYLSGSERAVFKVELPKGIYEFLIISGGSREDTYTEVKTGDGTETLIPVKKTLYGSGIFTIVHEKDREISLIIETKESSKWNLNLMMIKKLAALL